MVKVYDHQISSSLETPLHWAVMRGNYHIVKTLVQIYKDKQIEIDQKNVYGVTPFYLANIRQDKHICQVLFDNGADANESDKEGNTIAHVVSSLGDLKWLKYIIKHFNVNYYMKNEKGDSPFMMAVLNENVDVVEYYIELFKSNKNTLSANLDWKNKYSQTPLHAAVFTGNITIIKLLLANKAKIHIADVNELTPYHYAYIEDKEDVIKVIHEMLGVDKVPYINFK
jgi:ankyrin repeat protein